MAITFLSVLALCAVTPTLAGAAITNAPGATEGDQYFEEAPNGGGSGSVDRTPGAGGSQGVAATQALQASGPEGQAAADLANSNRPPAAGQGNASSQSSSPTEDQGGMGFWFPLLLAVTALAAIAYGVRRRLTPA